MATTDFTDIFNAVEQLRKIAQDSGMFMFIQNTLQYDNPQINVAIDRSKAGTLGISMQEIGDALATALGGNYVNFYSMQGFLLLAFFNADDFS